MKYKIFKNPSTVFSQVNEADVRLLTVEGTTLEFECGDEILFPCKMMIAVMDLDNFEFKEFIFNNCHLIEKCAEELTNHYIISTDEGEKQLPVLNGLLGKLTDVEKIFNETRNSQNSILKAKRPDVLPYPYSKDNEYYESFEQQKKDIFDSVNCSLDVPENIELALVVNEFKYYNKVLQSGFKEAFNHYIADSGLANSRLFSRTLSRVYIGSDFCNQLFPNDILLQKLLTQAYEENLNITVSYPVLIQRNLAPLKQSINIINAFCLEKDIEIELTINDYGMLQMLQEGKFSGIKPVLGRLLNKRKKDPRLKYRMAYDTYKEKLGINNLNVEHYLNFLAKYNVTRFEFETCDFLNEIPEGAHTLHFPFYQISTATNCLLYANCKNHTVAKQELPENCPHYCSEFYFSYPKHLNMIGKNNSIFGVDKEFLSKQEIIDYYAEAGIDRLAFTPL
ncbi:hypothetical protein [Parasporobacterium paucivorans]|uniref:Uncharacterized protein n=1 Tax=Parasporobacterium paucivorans DSM 15970 TaxID=1122934 RepID=A0A1M6A7Y9_9FIRM|nr:hypothetical protein [Parasporobacterium paucivorans]SHI32283.1 hypothetical protein SAMN02745691_00086 [Parasporobacterium paucivorans DSM 15970]